MKIIKTSIFYFILILLIGCRGDHSAKPPIHPNPNMDSQDKFKAYSQNNFFPDSSAMRMPVEGTIAQNKDFGNIEYLTGKDASGNLISDAEFINDDMVERGRDRFDIYCAVCHGPKADGNGNITKYKYPIPPTDLRQDWLIERPDGHYFDVITNGIRTMPSYSHQIPVEDRWAIISYVRKLQDEAK